MGDLAVPVAAIRAAGGAAAQVVTGVGEVDLGTPCADVAAALPGSRCAEAGVAAAQRWRAELTDVIARMGRHAQNLTASADTYEHHEQRTSAAFSAIMATLPGVATTAAPDSTIRQALG